MSNSSKGAFDVDLFRKLVRLLDSDQEGERSTALRQALRQCAEHDPPLLFCEAAERVFGQDGSESRRMELQAALSRVAELETEVARLMAELANAPTETPQARKRRPETGRVETTEDWDARLRRMWHAWPGLPWSWSNSVLLLVGNALVAMRIAAYYQDKGITSHPWGVTYFALVSWLAIALYRSEGRPEVSTRCG